VQASADGFGGVCLKARCRYRIARLTVAEPLVHRQRIVYLAMPAVANAR